MLHPNANMADFLCMEILYAYEIKFAESWQYNKAPDEWYSEES